MSSRARSSSPVSEARNTRVSGGRACASIAPRIWAITASVGGHACCRLVQYLRCACLSACSLALVCITCGPHALVLVTRAAGWPRTSYHSAANAPPRNPATPRP